MYYKKYTFTDKSELVDFAGRERLADRFTGTGGWNPGGRGEEHKVPLCFRAPVPEKGVYAVTVTIEGGDRGTEGINLYTGRRNLVKRDIVISPGEVFTCRFYCHVCEYIPIVGKAASLDCGIYVSAIGDNPHITSVIVESAEAPTLFIAGDSLVADYDGLYPYNPMVNGGSWGQNMLQYFDGLAVSDQAHGGMTTNCFRDDGHWEIVRDNIRPGDVFMIEFGHNDQKRRYLKAFDQYASNLRWYIKQIRERSAFPVLVTPLSRIPGRDEDGYYDLLEDYAESCLRVGRECHVPVIDLHEFSFRWLCEVGREVSKNYFNDSTHTNDYGALLVADYIAGEIERQRIEPLCENMNGSRPVPWVPDESLRPVEEISSVDKEEKPILSIDLPELPYVDCVGIPQEEELKAAMALGLLDPCLKYFHPFDEMPRGQFLYQFFKAVKSTSNRSYEGKYCDIYRYEFGSQGLQAAIDMGLIDETTTKDDRFRPDDGLTCGELISLIVRSCETEGNRDIGIEECEKRADSMGLLWEGYERDKYVNRADCTVGLVRLMRSRK